MKTRFSIVVPAVLALLAGCSRDNGVPAGFETDDAMYKQAKGLESQGHPQEALAYYLKVIEQRRDNAPESHLDAGIIFLRDMRQPIEAIHYFNRYLALKPNASNADLVRQRIEDATREFARTLPGKPLENQIEQLELRDQLERLKRENDTLKAEIHTLSVGTVTNAPPIISIGTGSPQPAANRGDGLSLARPAGPQDAGGSRGSQPAATNTKAAAPAPKSGAGARGSPATKSSPQTGGRTHTVAPSDSLYQIAIRYYGKDNALANAEKIAAANGVSSANLKPGMVLKIP